MKSRQFSRPGRKQLRRARLARDTRALSSTWRNAFVSICLAGLAAYAVTMPLAR